MAGLNTESILKNKMEGEKYTTSMTFGILLIQFKGKKNLLEMLEARQLVATVLFVPVVGVNKVQTSCLLVI